MKTLSVPRLSPIVKIVSAGCNLRCTYCFYSGQQNEIQVMSEETLRIVTERCLVASPSSIKFTWHGGEPTIPGTSFYRTALRLQRELARPGQKITNNIQTNGTLLTEEWVALLSTENLTIGVSLDGPEHLHNFARLNAAGKGSFHQTVRGIRLLRSAGIKFGVIAVINSHNIHYPEEIFNFFYNLGISFSANQCTAQSQDPVEAKELAVSPLEYAKFLLRLFDLWVERDDPKFRIRPLDDIVKAVMGKQPNLCKFQGMCHRYLTIDYNGDIYPCDEFLNPRYLLGNLTSEPMEAIFSSERLQTYYAGREVMWSVCKKCPWFLTCKGGCMRDWGGEKTLTNPEDEEFCQSRRLLFASISSKIRQLGYSPVLGG